MEMITLETQRLIIRNFQVGDWEALHEMIVQYAASEVAAYDHAWPTSPEEIRKIATWFAAADGYFAVCLKDTGRFIGFVSLIPEREGERREFGIGYIFNFDYHGHGYATEACRAVINHAFEHLRAHRVSTGTAAANQASCRLLERLGFKKIAESMGSLRNTEDGSPITFLGYTYAISRDIPGVVAAIERLARERGRPILVALDGGSGAGKSTVAACLAQEVGGVVVPLDDFFAAHIPEQEWEARSAPERMRDVFDWQRLRIEALEPLLAGRDARWHPFDFEAGQRPDGTYGMSARIIERQAAPVIILDGAYSAAPQLADLVDLAVLVDCPVAERHRRLAGREDAGFLQRWHDLWDDVEAYYFTEVKPRSSFDLIVSH